jgi:hypothetical protein
MKMPWMRGPATDRGTVFVSATRFTYRRLWYLPTVFWHGMTLRSRWPEVAGAVGMFTGASLLARTTFTLTAWRGEDDLHRWMRSDYHAGLMRSYRSWLESSSMVSWSTEAFDPESAWTEGLARLRKSR